MKSPSVRLLFCLILLGIFAQLAFAQAPVTLQYKFTPGQNLNYLVTFNATSTMTMQPASPQMMPSMDMSLQGNMDFTQQVTKVYPDGSADLALQLPRATVNASVMGQNINAQIKSGKISLTINGQASQMPSDMDTSQLPLLGTPLNMRMDKTGKVTDFSLPDMGSFENLMKSSGMDMSEMLRCSQGQLPDHPVAVGDSWTQTMAVPMSEGGAPMQIKMVSTLLGYEGIGGQQAAKIQIKGTALANNIKMPTPQMPAGAQNQNMPKIDSTIESLNMDIVGVVWFSPQLGKVMKNQQTMTMKEVMAISSGAGNTQRTTIEMRMNVGMFAK